MESYIKQGGERFLPMKVGKDSLPLYGFAYLVGVFIYKE